MGSDKAFIAKSLQTYYTEHCLIGKAALVFVIQTQFTTNCTRISTVVQEMEMEELGQQGQSNCNFPHSPISI